MNLNEINKFEKYLVISVIGNNETYISMVNNHGLNVCKDIEFPDHYKYSDSDINLILNQANNLNCKIITTEKDYFRIENDKLDQIKYLKSELKIIDEENLIKIILK